jgi:hypothetical protein
MWTENLVIDCDRAESQVLFDEPEDEGIFARHVREEPASYVSFAMRRVDCRIMRMCGMS